MTCQPSRSLPSLAAPPARSLADERPFAVGGLVTTRPAPDQAAAEPRSGFWRWLSRPRLPRLVLDDLSEHRQRDLGFRDGRWTPPRDELGN